MLVISPNGRDGSATIHQDADIYLVRLKPGQTVTYELKAGRGAWLHYQIEYATSSVSWTKLVDLSLPSSPFTFIDSGALNANARFCRVVVP